MNIVQIGACVGNDSLTEIINNSGHIDKLVLVEPMEVHNVKIKNFYSDQPHIIENSAIITDPNKKYVSFFYHTEDGPNYEVSSVNKDHILKHVIYNDKLTEDGIVELSVPALTINNLFEKHSLDHIDFLHIDAEGLDDQIIMSIDFDKYNVEKIYFEHHHIDVNNIVEFLNKKGYSSSVAGSWGQDILSKKIK